MAAIFDRAMRRAVYSGSQMVPSLKRWVKANPKLASIAFDVWNSNYFNRAEIHEKMLADRLRVETYFQAISKHVQEGDVVVDLGTGTGILSFFASQQNPAKVHAIEHSSMVENAKHLAAANGITNVEFHRCNSKDFQLDGKADVMIHEQIGSAIFNENMIENVTDLRDRVLKRGGKILPNRFEVFLEPVQIKEEFLVPFIWEMNLHGIRFDSLKVDVDRPSENKTLLQHERWRFIRPFEIERLLCEPRPLFEVDLETMAATDNPGPIVYENCAVEDGRIDGMLLYFTAHFDEEISISTTPLNAETSWLPSLYRLEQQTIAAGDVVKYELNMPALRDYRAWQVEWQTERAPSNQPPFPPVAA